MKNFNFPQENNENQRDEHRAPRPRRHFEGNSPTGEFGGEFTEPDSRFPGGDHHGKSGREGRGGHHGPSRRGGKPGFGPGENPEANPDDGGFGNGFGPRGGRFAAGFGPRGGGPRGPGDGPRGPRGGPGGGTRGPGGEAKDGGPDFGPGFGPGLRAGFGPGFGHGSPGPGGRGRPGFRSGFGQGGRVRKGNVRSAILSLLSQHSYNGYGMIGAIGAHTDGAWRPSPGSIYPALAALQAEGLIESTGDGKRTEFELTEAGKAYVAENIEEMAQVWADVNQEAGAGTELRLSMGKLTGAVQQIGMGGTEEQLKTATEALDTARRTIYKLLAD